MATTTPITPGKFYDFAQVNIIVDGFSLSGFDDDGGVEYDVQSEEYEHAVGADGQTTVSRTNDPRAVVTITVKQTGKANTILSSLQQEQAAQPNPFQPPIVYVHRDPNTGDVINEPQAVFLQRPSPNANKTAGSREFTLLLPHFAQNVNPAGVQNA